MGFEYLLTVREKPSTLERTYKKFTFHFVFSSCQCLDCKKLKMKNKLEDKVSYQIEKQTAFLDLKNINKHSFFCPLDK